MPNYDKAKSYGSLLNRIPLSPDDPDDYAIELCPVNNGDEVWWRWAIRRGGDLERGLSGISFQTRDGAFVAASDWWGKNFKTYWNHSYFMPNGKPSLEELRSRLAEAKSMH